MSNDSTPFSQRFKSNRTGRDFVVGDVHGMFSALETLLRTIRFDPVHDRLFSVGDLVDRGPRSRDALTWLAQPWFHAVRGNHEDLLLNAHVPMVFLNWMRNGGAWWNECTTEEQETLRTACRALPITITIETEHGAVGIVHADIPPSLSWAEFQTHIEQNDPHTIDYALWSRERIRNAHPAPVAGIDRIIAGHTPTSHPVVRANVHFIDTAAAFTQRPNARLTALELTASFEPVHAVATAHLRQ